MGYNIPTKVAFFDWDAQKQTFTIGNDPTRQSSV